MMIPRHIPSLPSQACEVESATATGSKLDETRILFGVVLDTPVLYGRKSVSERY